MNNASIRDAGIGQAFGEPHALAGQVRALSDVAAHQRPLPGSQHGSEQLRRLFGPFAQLAGTRQDGPDFGSGVPANGDVTGRQRAQELQLVVVTLRRLRQRREERTTLRQVADRFVVFGAIP